MPGINISDLEGLTIEDLKGDIASKQKDLMTMRFDHATKGLDNAISIRTTRRDIAKLKTVLRQKELADQDPALRSKIRNRRSRS